MGDKNSFIMYTDFPKTAAGLSDAVFREIVCAACHYVETGEVPDMTAEGKIAFPFLKTTLDRDAVKWEIERQKRSEAGKKGADARWNGK
ncbi:DUF6291 domain-containing protein [Ruminococcaceae bacterium OttesenSCG-928-D13]|nr:DUF6291 domain-containing protein [Ruminococcaceae bacterium OttesenSCG-928-D13]